MKPGTAQSPLSAPWAEPQQGAQRSLQFMRPRIWCGIQKKMSGFQGTLGSRRASWRKWSCSWTLKKEHDCELKAFQAKGTSWVKALRQAHGVGVGGRLWGWVEGPDWAMKEMRWTCPLEARWQKEKGVCTLLLTC